MFTVLYKKKKTLGLYNQLPPVATVQGLKFCIIEGMLL